MKIRHVRAEIFHADRQTDMTKLIVALHNFAKEPIYNIYLSTVIVYVYVCIYIYIYIITVDRYGVKNNLGELVTDGKTSVSS
jgi:hypothetical protein